MKIGFTGTQEGMTTKQRKEFLYTLGILQSGDEMHYGDCIGADWEAFSIVTLNLPKIRLISHPPINKSKRAFSKPHKEFPAKEYLIRNQDTVDSSDLLIACPKDKQEELRSGTWSVIRYARRQLKNLLIIFPDGSTLREIRKAPRM